MSQQAAVKLTGIEQSRPHFQLGPIDLEVPKGCVTAIVGPNGSGKSSAFRLILNLEKAAKGEVTVLGEQIGSGNDAELKQRIGYLPELFGSHDGKMRASEKTAFVRRWYTDWNLNRYRELLRVFEVDDSIKLGKMSKGTRRKYELALALSHHPELLLLDEPSSGLDPLAWRTMIDVLHRYMEDGERTIIMASHIIEEVKRLADYIVFMGHGRVLGVFEKDELFSSWHSYYISGEGFTRKAAEQIPGQCLIEDNGGGTFRVVTKEAFAAERWLEETGLRIVGRQALSLDDILAILIEQERLRVRS
ncbi:ABC transporter ATP-binding protein [Paenibacillus sp. NEAU-GSW1]|uniref:ABC transporter ATP-binding protein n=1 Tax=Paenibacillus sp. NEAU-GSW1 TaxID=2682486 RepID=UPI0012E2BD89|nr:ABC transporter ATP-binding protein [Paenibacillus sp. NEAU-GSW1]MUT65345.1 ATP-binding cassette domain-containing protein [Paenibacillus sp. NEAU-GSW1]